MQPGGGSVSAARIHAGLGGRDFVVQAGAVAAPHLNRAALWRGGDHPAGGAGDSDDTAVPGAGG